MINREPPPPPSRRRTAPRRLLGFIVAGFVLFLLTMRSIATFWTDYLWYDSVGQTGVWRTLVFTRVWLVALATLVAFVVFWASLWLADRLSPRRGVIPGSPDEELLERFQDFVGPRVFWVRTGVAAFFGLMIGLGAAVAWEDFLLFRNGVPFGIDDPIFGNDIGLYVFSLPWYRALFGWAFQLIFIVTLVTAAVHYLNGGIQVNRTFGDRVNPGVKVHLSVLLAVLAILKAVGYQLDKWDLLYSARGQVIGASYTDVNAQIPALNLLIAISLVAAVILLVNLRFRGWTLPAVALGLWLFTSIVVGGFYPAFIQRFQVVPDEINKETEFVAHNIEFTRDAYGLSTVEVRPFAAATDLDAQDLEENADTIDNIRLWDPGVLEVTYRELQEIRTFYRIEDVDVDRYDISSDLTQVMVSARELDERNIPGGGWVNERLVYTHGFGVVLSPANDVTTEGRPEFLVKDIPPVTAVPELEVDQPRIYFSDSADLDHVIAGSLQEEVDFPIGESGDNVRFNRYDGNGGVELGNLVRRAAWALRFGEIDILISGRVTADAKVLMERNLRHRLGRVAPFLHGDADPYLVLDQGRLKWVMDLYTITDRYPYSAMADTARLNQGEGLPNRFNYIRNSVKAVVDAYDGDMTLYVVDPDDPLIKAQREIFPTVFTDQSEMPESLRAHLRYPEDLFRVQSDIYRLYHITDPVQFFQIVDPWQIARDPSNSPRPDLRARFVDESGNEFRPMLPYYLLMKLPGEDELSFLIMQPFTPRARPNMVSFMVAKSGPADYGRIIDFRLPAASAQPGPGQVGEFINQDTEISAEFTLLGQSGSRVIQGNMLIVPIEESLLYVQPIYIAASVEGQTRDNLGIPEFKRVVVSFNNQIEMRNSLPEALAAIFGAAPADGGVIQRPPGQVGGEIPPEVAQLIADAARLLEEADAALRNGDLATYGAKVAEAAQLIQQARDLVSGG